MSLSCSASASDSTGSGVSASWEADVDAQATAGLSLDVSVGFGIPPSVRASTSLVVGASANASFSATVATDVAETVPLGETDWEPIDIQIGPVPVVIVPSTSADLKLTGHLEDTLSGNAGYSADMSVSCDTDSGCSSSHSENGAGTATYQNTASANLRAAFEPSIQALLYDVAGVTASLSPYLNVDGSTCALVLTAGINLDVGVKVEIWDKTLIDESVTIPVIEKQLAVLPLSNCSWWSGSFTYRTQEDAVTTGSDGVGGTEKVKGSAGMTIADVGGVPPPNGGYQITGSGGGVKIDTSVLGAEAGVCDGETDKSTLDWSGAIADFPGNLLPLEVDANSDREYVFTISEDLVYAAEGSLTNDFFNPDIDGANCVEDKGSTNDRAAGSLVFTLFSHGETGTPSGTLNITLPPNSNVSTGTATMTQDGITMTLIWKLTKHCLKGGTRCV